jgi:serine/threonine-protein kinase RsbW
VDIKFTLSLPRDALSVPIVRRVLTSCMQTLGVSEECLRDIEVALTEACTNVLDHVLAGDEYEVVAGLNDEMCVIQVVDAGHGFDPDIHGRADADTSAEGGRGIQLIRALVDRVHFQSRPEAGTIVHLEKRLEYAEGSPMSRLLERQSLSSGTIDITGAEATLQERDAALAVADPEPGAG